MNEVYAGIPYRVARYEDLGLGTHSNYTYRIRKVMKDGTKGAFSEPFTGRTRQVWETEVIESEGLRCEINRNGAYVTGWCPEGGEEVHGGVSICWPWFGKPPREGLPKHGFVRYAKWRMEEKIGKNAIRWSLVSTPETMKLWPHEFRLDYIVKAVGDRLELELKATNTGSKPFEAAGGFHPCFNAADPLRVAVDGKPVAVKSCRGKEFFCAEPCSAKSYVLRPGESKTISLTVTAGRLLPMAVSRP